MNKPIEIALLFLGAPVVKIELDQSQLDQIQEYVEAVVEIAGVTDDKKKELMIVDGVLAYSKLVLGRIRSKFQNFPGSGDTKIAMDGQQLVYEALSAISEWKAELFPEIRE